MVPWRVAALTGVSVAVFLAARDMVGFGDPVPVSSVPYAFHWHLWGFVRLLMLFVAATVAWWGAHRQAARTLACALIGISFNNNWWFYAADDPLLWPSVVLNYLGLGFGLAYFMIFAGTYGQGDWRRIRLYITRLAPYLGGLIGLFGMLWWTSLHPLFNRVFWGGWDLVNVLVIVASFIAVRHANPSERTATTWVLVSFSIAAFGTWLHGVDRQFQGDTEWANIVDTVAQAALPVGLAYGVLRHRALDIDFLINRVVLFSSLTLSLGVLFTLAEVLTHKWVDSLKLVPEGSRIPANVVEILLSMGVVRSYKRLESKVDQIVERWRPATSGTRSETP